MPMPGRDLLVRRGQRALFDRFDWDEPVDFSNFEGTPYMQTGGVDRRHSNPTASDSVLRFALF